MLPHHELKKWLIKASQYSKRCFFIEGKRMALWAATYRKAEAQPKGGPLSQSAAMLCMTEKFFDFIADRYVTSMDVCTVKSDETQNEYCRQAICDICGIESRAELDHNETAAARFRELMGEYSGWLDHSV